MENYTLGQDIKTFYVTATSFPDGVMAAHERLHAIVPDGDGRRFFGISRPEGSKGIVYKAAAEELHDGEGKELDCETYIIKQGSYKSVMIKDFMKDIPAIGKAFQLLLADSDIDPDGACIEWYMNDTDVLCMVRLKD